MWAGIFKYGSFCLFFIVCTFMVGQWAWPYCVASSYILILARAAMTKSLAPQFYWGVIPLKFVPVRFFPFTYQHIYASMHLPFTNNQSLRDQLPV